MSRNNLEYSTTSCIAAKNVLLFYILIIFYFMQTLLKYITTCCSPEPEQYEQRYELSDHNEWKNNGGGNFEFIGGKFSNAPNDIKNQIISLTVGNLSPSRNNSAYIDEYPILTKVNAPNVEGIQIDRCHNLTSIEAPNADRVAISRCPNLTSIEALKADRVAILECQALTMVNAPNVRDFNADLTTLDTLIKAVKNPQNLQGFYVDCPDNRSLHLKNIAPCIKDADRELNGNDGAKINRANIMRASLFNGIIGKKLTKNTEGKDIRRELVEGFNSSCAVSVIGEFLTQGEMHKISSLNSKGRKEINKELNLSDYANLGKTNIVMKTREIASGRGIQL